jgi:DNA-binding transcriptional regulator YbjK
MRSSPIAQARGAQQRCVPGARLERFAAAKRHHVRRDAAASIAGRLCYNGTMPKIVDHDQRRQSIAEAAWQVIRKHGMKGASVRNIANEAGLSLGALRHYFSTQEELYRFAMNLVIERVGKRMAAVAAGSLPPKEKAIAFLEQMLPMDDESRTEMEVWFHFTYHYYGKGEGGKDGIRHAIRKTIDYLDDAQLLDDTLDKELETERLYALINGLALHKFTEDKRLTDAMMRRVLTRHIESLLKR